MSSAKKTGGGRKTAEQRTEEKQKVLKVKSGMKYRGAREQWYEVLQQYEGHTAQEFLEATAKKPPSLTKKNEAEKPTGWLRFFERTGVASYE